MKKIKQNNIKIKRKQKKEKWYLKLLNPCYYLKQALNVKNIHLIFNLNQTTIIAAGYKFPASSLFLHNHCRSHIMVSSNLTQQPVSARGVNKSS